MHTTAFLMPWMMTSQSISAFHNTLRNVQSESSSSARLSAGTAVARRTRRAAAATRQGTAASSASTRIGRPITRTAAIALAASPSWKRPPSITSRAPATSTRSTDTAPRPTTSSRFQWTNERGLSWTTTRLKAHIGSRNLTLRQSDN